MAKSFVLQALKIFGLEEILNLSKVGSSKAIPKKMAAGAELIVWSDAPEESSHVPESHSRPADILPFRKSVAAPLPDQLTPVGENNEDAQKIFSSEFMLWQRELSKDNTSSTKKDAVKGYSRATEMYVVKTPDLEGKEKIRFASTNGILVDKKQA